jgi:hypothetical protein
MSTVAPLLPPPGFEQLSKDQQIDYVQQLWDMILTLPEDMPSPEWHLEVVRDRISTQNATNLQSWDEVKQSLENKYGRF